MNSNAAGPERAVAENAEAPRHFHPARGSSGRLVGIDVDAEAIKLVELSRQEGQFRCVRRQLIEHGKEPAARLIEALLDWKKADTH